ncbi:hypothetical protein [Nostoc sp. 106C]|uniref:hypothetical protein n=1 Tax=Nostoc sp. 106C TaxID=1932667 RepID=UPI0011817411|nr:hypothetical protein [Nostoc sp. 106C]
MTGTQGSHASPLNEGELPHAAGSPSRATGESSPVRRSRSRRVGRWALTAHRIKVKPGNPFASSSWGNQPTSFKSSMLLNAVAPQYRTADAPTLLPYRDAKSDRTTLRFKI